MRPAAFFKSIPGAVLSVFVLAFAASMPIAFGATKATALGGAVLALAALLCFAGIPLIIITRVFRESPRDYGFRLPENAKQAFIRGLLVFIPHALAGFLLLQSPEVRAYYSLAGRSLGEIAFFLPLLAAYFFAEEALFRGFFLFALARYRAWGVVINVIVFTLLHGGKPGPEMVYAALSAALLCWLTLKTKSFVPAVLIHFASALLVTGLGNWLYH